MAPDPKLVAERDAKVQALGPRPPWWRLFARRRWDERMATIMAMDVGAFTAMLRDMYPPQVVRDMAIQQSPVMQDWMTKVKR